MFFQKGENMGETIRKSFMWLLFLKELEKNQVINSKEKERLLDEFDTPDFAFRAIKLEEKKNLIEEVKSFLGIDIKKLNAKISSLQNESLIKDRLVPLICTWISIERYADEQKRHIVALIHALMAKHIEI